MTLTPRFSNPWGGTFILCEPGSFTMGARRPLFDELQQAEVEIKQPFFIGERPLTQMEWSAVMSTEPSRFQEGWSSGLRPVEMISWLDAMRFIEKLNEIDTESKFELTGSWRLPTEAEWEYAARAGTQTRWHFGDEDNELDSHGWHAGNSGATTRQTGQKSSNPWGLFDMHGMVGEWCADEARDGRRVHKGGSWFTESESTRCAARSTAAPDKKSDGIGMRLVWAPL